MTPLAQGAQDETIRVVRHGLSTATMAGCEKLNETLDAALEKVAREEGASTTRRARSATGPNPAFEARERRGSEPEALGGAVVRPR